MALVVSRPRMRALRRADAYALVRLTWVRAMLTVSFSATGGLCIGRARHPVGVRGVSTAGAGAGVRGR